MKLKTLIVIVSILIISFTIFKTNAFYEQAPQPAYTQKTTLFATHERKDKNYGKDSFSFQYGLRSDAGKETKNDWDIKYGYASIDGSSDYFGVTMVSNDRSRIKDLGRLNWADIKQAPVLLASPGPYKGVRFPLRGEPIEVTSEGQVAKAVESHIYVAHIKDDDTDLYVLFRVEKLTPNEMCTIAWKVVPSPEEHK